ncbi:MAG TPA: response regulator [Candidatus Saccharimonadales bacterium]|nr:response regulator [Candidatus Saccharimonadales bacterium]
MQRKILIIEDDIDILDAIQFILERENYEVWSTTKGEEVYKKIKEFKPELIILDVLISGSDGRTICKNLKSNKQTSHIPVIMMSAHPTVEKEYKQFGGDDFLAKPFETDELLSAVNNNLLTK